MPLTKDQLDFFAAHGGTQPGPSLGWLHAHYTQGDKVRPVLICEASGTCYDGGTALDVAKRLERYISTGQRVRLFLGDPAKGENWMEENDVVGRISRSMGPIKSPLLIPRTDSHGGGAILTACIMAIALAPGVFDYKHPAFKVPTVDVRHEPDKAPTEVPWKAYLDGEASYHAGFRSEVSARRWAAFMRGERMAK